MVNSTLRLSRSVASDLQNGTRKRIDTGRSSTPHVKSANSPSINFVVAIPSYKRSEAISKKTLKCLESLNIPPDYIFVFVANESEKELYQKNNPTYANIIVSALGKCASCNFIIDYFKEGQDLSLIHI